MAAAEGSMQKEQGIGACLERKGRRDTAQEGTCRQSSILAHFLGGVDRFSFRPTFLLFVQLDFGAAAAASKTTLAVVLPLDPGSVRWGSQKRE